METIAIQEGVIKNGQAQGLDIVASQQQVHSKFFLVLKKSYWFSGEHHHRQ